uniref:Uncharacterized protein n=1 Tax=Anguilla anguilla TaxID=7936 RepID=A0A0E9TQ95_ANGAN
MFTLISLLNFTMALEKKGMTL